MQQFKVKLNKPLKHASFKPINKESPIIKEILPEIEFYKFDEFSQEVPEDFDEPVSFDDLFESESNRLSLSKSPQKLTKASKPRFYVEFSIRNFNKPLNIDLSKQNQIIATSDEIQNQVQSAYDQGFEDGRQVTQLALAEEFKKFENWIKNIDLVTEKLTKNFSEELKKLGKAVVPIAIQIAKLIIRKEVEQNSEILLEQVQNVLEAIENETIFKIRINPEDVGIIQTVGSRLPQLSGIELIADPTIERGGCIVETSIGTIDATFQSQLEKIAQNLNSMELYLDNLDV